MGIREKAQKITKENAEFESSLAAQEERSLTKKKHLNYALHSHLKDQYEFLKSKGIESAYDSNEDFVTFHSDNGNKLISFTPNIENSRYMAIAKMNVSEKKGIVILEKSIDYDQTFPRTDLDLDAVEQVISEVFHKELEG